MKIISFKDVSISVFIVRTVLVLAFASLAAELFFHLPDGWRNDGTVWRMLIESLLIVVLFTPLLWWYVLKPLRQVSAEASHQVEQQLLSLTEATLEATADGIVVLDTNLQVVLYNQKYLAMWGDAAGIFKKYSDGRQIFEQIRGYLCDPDEFLQKSLQSYSDVERTFIEEVRFRNGKIYERYTQPQKLHDTTIGWVSSYHDITEKRHAEQALRESEERFRQIVEQSDDALFLCTSDGLIIDLNKAAVHLFGYAKDELVSQPLQLLFDGTNYMQLCKAIDAAGSENGSRLESLVAHDKAAREFIITLRVKNLELTGEVVLLLAMNDITEKIRLDEYTREIQAKLIQANKMSSLGLLVSGIAHEINNPNNYIMISSELVSRVWNDCLPILQTQHAEHGDFQVGGVPFSTFEPEAAELIDGITEGSRRIRDIVNSLKDFSRDSRGLQEMNVDLNRVVSAATTIIAHHIKRLTHRFQLHCAENLPLFTGNRYQLEQVTINLILNALQSLNSPDSAVVVSTSHDVQTGEVVLTVSDQGRGIPEDVRARIMEPFFTTRLDSGGTGLGLSICRTIINEHHGVITFTSDSGIGTVFTIRIPIRGAAV